jgi:aminopeptidase N
MLLPIAKSSPALSFVLALSVFAHEDIRPGAAGAGDHYFPELGNGGYDVQHYDLEFDLDATLTQLVATARIRAVATHALSRFNLDLHGFDVRTVAVNDGACTFARENDELIVTPEQTLATNQEFVVTVAYAGTPRAIKSPALGNTPIGWMHSKRGVFVDHPSDKATYRIEVKVPPPWTVASNGTPEPERQVGDKVAYTFSSRDPMASYLVTVAICEFDFETATSDSGLPMRYWFPKRLGERGRASLRKSGAMIDHFATLFGPYPFESGGGIVAAIAIPGALETQTVPIYGLYATDEAIVAHEVAHQWFGNNVTMREWKDIWLAEGFAEYGAWLWLEHTDGREALEDRVESEHRQVRGRKVRGSADPGPTALFGEESYNRGPLVLHALRRTVGDETFFAILREWNARYRYGTATIDDFIALVNELAGRDYSTLLCAWLEDPIAPLLGEF